MTAKEFLIEKYGDKADESTISTTFYKMAQMMEEYHQMKLKELLPTDEEIGHMIDEWDIEVRGVAKCCYNEILDKIGGNK